MKLSRKGWQRAVNALLWYPENKKEYEQLEEELQARDPDREGNDSKPLRPDPTAATAIRMAENRRYQNICREIEAVELAVSSLRPEQKEVIRRRFWTYQGRGRRKPRQYDFLQDLGYSLDGMRKIVKKVIVSVAVYLGEK